MAKIKAVPTREDKINSAIATLAEVPTTTKVKAWSFKVDKQTYVILSFRNKIDFINVYPSTRAGRKTSDTPIVSIANTLDHLQGLDAALELLVPQEN
jgi:hypothetical protein